MAKAQVQSTKLSWSRANRLHELTNQECGVADCRAYLATQNGQAKILDTGKDARTPDIRNLIQGFEEWYGAGNRFNSGKSPRPRRAKGDNTKPPRAGHPPLRGTSKTRTKTKGFGSLDSQPLFELREIQRKHDLTITQLAYMVEFLGRIIDSPIDIDHFLREVKQSRKS